MKTLNDKILEAVDEHVLAGVVIISKQDLLELVKDFMRMAQLDTEVQKELFSLSDEE